MKKITLPIAQSYTMGLDLQNLPSPIVRPDGSRQILVGSMDIGAAGPVVLASRENGAQVVYAAGSIERQMNEIILQYFFGPVSQRNPKRDFFLQNSCNPPVSPSHSNATPSRNSLMTSNFLKAPRRITSLRT